MIKRYNWPGDRKTVKFVTANAVKPVTAHEVINHLIALCKSFHSRIHVKGGDYWGNRQGQEISKSLQVRIPGNSARVSRAKSRNESKKFNVSVFAQNTKTLTLNLKNTCIFGKIVLTKRKGR